MTTKGVFCPGHSLYEIVFATLSEIYACTSWPMKTHSGTLMHWEKQRCGLAGDSLSAEVFTIGAPVQKVV